MKHIIKFSVTTTALLFTGLFTSTSAWSQTEPFMGEIRAFANTYCPRNWAETNGGTLSVSSHTALFSLLGTTYGGDGRTTFQLPNIKARTTMGSGIGPGLSDRRIGSQVGTERTIGVVQHTHELRAASTGPAEVDPNGASIPSHDVAVTPFKSNPSLNTTLATDTVTSSGNSSGVGNMQPYNVLRYCIALEGLYPSRS